MEVYICNFQFAFGTVTDLLVYVFPRFVVDWKLTKYMLIPQGLSRELDAKVLVGECSFGRKILTYIIHKYT